MRLYQSSLIRQSGFLCISFLTLMKVKWLHLVGVLLLSGLFLCSCSGLDGGVATTSAESSPTVVAVSKLHWCEKPLVLFRDESPATIGTATITAAASQTPNASPTATATGSPRTISDWAQVEPKLGFTIYLPASLPLNTCLISVSGTIHDPLLGGSFTIGYLLPDHSSISLSEAPLRSQNTVFQCSPAPSSNTNTSGGTTGASASKTGTPAATATAAVNSVMLCSGARDTTNIIFAAKGKVYDLQRFFNGLQPHVTWIPAA